MSTYTDASLIYYPSGYKASKAYSLKPTDGSGDLTFTRASSATRVNAEGLIEGVRTNLALYSNDLSNAVWNKTFTTITSNAAISPDGTNNANKIVETTDNNLHRAGQGSISVTSGQVYTFSFYAKAGERTELEIQRINTSGTVFNSISATTAELTLGTLSVGSNVTSSSINSVGDGWYRISLSLTAIATGSGGLNIGMQKDGNVIYLGDGTSGVFIYGFQAEQSALATEYIPTTTTAVSVGMLANVPRIDYTGGGCGKLLLEPQRTNSILISEDFANDYWTKFEATISSNVATSPDGTANADKLIPSTNSSRHSVYKSSQSINGGYYTVYAKADGYDWILLTSHGSSIPSSRGAYFNVANGTIGTEGNGIVASITDMGNGWYKCSINDGTSGSSLYTVIVTNADNTESFAGNGTDGVLIWAAQNEQGSYPTSYIPTSGTAVTRVADSASKTGITSFLSSSSGCLFFNFGANNQQNSAVLGGLINGDWGTSIITRVESVGLLRVDVINGFTLLFSYISNVQINNSKIAISWVGGVLKIYINGLLKQTSGSITIPSINQLILQGGQSAALLNYSQVLLFPTNLSDTDAIALTTL